MTGEERIRFALVLREAERVAAEVTREEAVYGSGAHDDGVPLAAPPGTGEPVLAVASAA